MKQDEKWNYMYSLLLEYYKENGNVEVPDSFIAPSGEYLGIWVSSQRTRFRINKLSIERQKKLELLGFRFEKINYDIRWEYMYGLLVKYYEETGNTEVPARFVTANGENLGTWVNTQRILYENNKLTLVKEEKLRLLGFRLETADPDIRWEYMYNLLVKYKTRYKDTEVTREYKTPSGENLGSWVNTQRVMYRKNKLSPDKEEKLRLLGFRFEKKSRDIKGFMLPYKDTYSEVEESKPLIRMRKR